MKKLTMGKAQRFAAYQDPAKYVKTQEDFNALMAAFIADFPIPIQALKGAALHWIPRMAAERAARHSHKNRPEQRAKVQIKKHWDLWQQQPSLYRFKTTFARKMLEKYPVIEDPRTVENWCRDWEKELSSA